MHDLGISLKDISAELVHNITDSYNSAKGLPDQSAEFKKTIQPVGGKHFMCDGSCQEFSHGP